MNKKVLILVFVLLAFVQLFIPVKMILDREDIIETGKEFKFKTAPIDPNDPFRGKYIVLHYEDNNFVIENEKDWTRGEIIYVQLMEDSVGFARIKSVSKEKPTNDVDYFKTTVQYPSSDNSNRLTVDYPFNRYYMEESKALHAEKIYRSSRADTTKTTYALVSIKNGDVVLKDVLIDGTSIREIVKASQESQ